MLLGEREESLVLLLRERTAYGTLSISVIKSALIYSFPRIVNSRVVKRALSCSCWTAQVTARSASLS